MCRNLIKGIVPPGSRAVAGFTERFIVHPGTLGICVFLAPLMLMPEKASACVILVQIIAALLAEIEAMRTFEM